ncbi:MAG: aldo/keto reductase, partial [Erysipelotrichaceae bacterium]|nr:aldo/keto reductase [Erysipelotrichaceae bacterium]
LDVSVLTIGTWAMGGMGYGDVNEKDCIDAIHAMVENGVNHIDTAWIYGLGRADEVVGKALKGLDRSKIYITSKVGFHNPADGKGPNYPDIRPEWIRECFEKSLVNLGTDYVDEFLVHFPDHSVDFKDVADCLHEYQKQGKIRHLGVSNFAVADIEEMAQYMEVTANQTKLNMIERDEVSNMEWCRDHNIGIMTHSSLCQGLLTGAIREIPHYAEDDVRSMYGNNFKEPMFSQIQDLLKVMDEVAANHNATDAQVAINWNVQKDYVTTSLVGVRNVNEALENCKATEWELSDDEMKLLDDAIENCIKEKAVTILGEK